MPALVEERHIRRTMVDQIPVALTITTTTLIKAPRQTDQAVPLVSGHRQVAALAALAVLVVLAVLAQGRCQALSRLVTCTPTSLLPELVVAEVVLGLVLGAHTEETAGPEAPTRMEEANHLKDTADPGALMEDRRQVNTDLGHHHGQGRMYMPISITAALVVPVVPAVPEGTTQREWVLSPHKLEDTQEESILEVPQVPKALATGQGHVQVLVCRVPVCRVLVCRAPIEPALLLQGKALHVLMCIARVLHQARLQHRASLVKHRANRVPQRLKIWVSHRVNRMVIA